MAGGGELIMPEGEDEEAMRAHESLENEAMLDEWVKAKRQKNSNPDPDPNPSPKAKPYP